MKRVMMSSVASLAATMALAGPAFAQVTVRVPFVRVQVGDGVHVRAPFVNLFVPSGPRVYVMPGAEPPPAFVPPPEALPFAPKKTLPAKPAPAAEIKPDDAPPAPAGLERVLTMEQFTKGFQAKAGNYEVTMLNPVSNQATTVRFTLPEGTPRRVRVSGNQIEFDYGPRQYVRIRFDRDGAEVISR